MSESTDAPRPVDPAYRRLPTEGPDAPDLGGALITWVEPMAEHVVAYNRWYEDDHMITGAMSMPWMFSCRRWVAPTSIQHLRGPADSTVAVPLEAGKYIGVYWVNGGRVDDHTEWSLGANYRLHAEGRGSCRGDGHDPLEERRHVFTAFADHLGTSYRDDGVPRTCTRWCSPTRAWSSRSSRPPTATVPPSTSGSSTTTCPPCRAGRWPSPSASRPGRCRPTAWPT